MRLIKHLQRCFLLIAPGRRSRLNWQSQPCVDLGVFIIHTQNKPNHGNREKAVISCLSIPGRDDGGNKSTKTRLRGNSLSMWADGTVTHFWEESLQTLYTKPQSHMKESLAAAIKYFGYRVNGAFMRHGAYQTQIIHRRDCPHMLWTN